jgi:hypothetical protein
MEETLTFEQWRSLEEDAVAELKPGDNVLVYNPQSTPCIIPATVDKVIYNHYGTS